jgi:hypothetical protein
MHPTMPHPIPMTTPPGDRIAVELTIEQASLLRQVLLKRISLLDDNRQRSTAWRAETDNSSWTKEASQLRQLLPLLTPRLDA